MSRTDVRRLRAERARLRASVLRCGQLLGWPTRTVIAVAEDLARRPWKRCRRTELDGVLDELQTIVWACEARRDPPLAAVAAQAAAAGCPGVRRARRA